jgi:hypothetical protein
MEMETASDYRKNSFICQSIKILKIDDKEILLDIENIKQDISSLYILCIKDDYKIPYQFFFQFISYELLLEVNKHLIIIKVPIRMLKNMHHFNNIIVLSDMQLQLYNIFNYPLESKNIVLPIFTINYLNILSYINQYEKYKLTNLINIINLNHKFNHNTSNFCDLIKKLSGSKYWTKSRNINFTNAFINRRLSNKSNTRFSTMDNYIGLTHDVNTLSVDISNTVPPVYRSKKHYTDYACKNIQYKIKPSEIIYDQINELFNYLPKKEQELLFMYLLISKKYIHLVINNVHILTLLSSFIHENSTLVKYLLSYAWITLYLEECIQGNKTKIDDRYIFSVNTANKLPYYTFDNLNPKNNPYMPLLVHDLEHSPEILHGVKDRFVHTGGICNLEDFQKRINIFITGENDDIFQGLDFKKYNICITGGIIAACGPKYIPIRLNTTTSVVDGNPASITDIEDNMFKTFINTYYPDSDVDMIIKDVDITTKEGYTKFIDTVNVIYDTIKEKHIDTELLISPLNYLFVSNEYINNHINLDNVVPNKVIYISSHINQPEIIEKFKPLYEQLKAQRREEFVQKYSLEEITKWESKYNYMLNNDNFKICISSDKSESYSLVFTCKAHITSSGLSRKLELFSIKENDFFSVVSTFHFPCVRGIYDGSNVYLTPSCITAFMTLKLIDYKYVCCAKNPIELMLKYTNRGYGIYLNIDEKKSVIKYIMKNEKYWEQYNITNYDTYKTACDKIFKPLNILLHEDCPITPSEEHMKHKPSVIPSNISSSYRAIDKFGNITPLDMNGL